MQRTRFFQTCLGVFQGGGCRGPALVGALKEVQARGVDFAGVAGASAGSIVAALVGAGATPDFLEEAIKALDFPSLLERPEPIPARLQILERAALALARTVNRGAANLWEYHGLYSSRGVELWMREQLRKLFPKTTDVTFKDLPIPTYVIATDIFTKSVKVWSSTATPDESVAFAVRCSCSIPGFFQPVSDRYIDGGVLSNLPAFVFDDGSDAGSKPYASRILAFTLNAPEKLMPPKTGKELFEAAVNTIVGGASDLQARLVRSVHYISIDTGDIQATDFDKMNDDKVRWLLDEGRKAAKEFLDDEPARVRRLRQCAYTLSGEDEIYSEITEALDDTAINDVIISNDNTRWVYSLFPTLLAWRTRNVRVRIVLPEGADKPHQAYQRRLLRALGAELFISKIPFRGFLMNPKDPWHARAIVFPETLPDEDLAVGYFTPHDFLPIKALSEMIDTVVATGDTKSLPTKPAIAKAPQDLIIDKLRENVAAYSIDGVRLSLEPIPVKAIWLMTRMIRGFKFKQIGTLFKLFKRAELDCFNAAEVRYGDGMSTIVTPPVVEASGDRFILVQGNTRAFYCYKNDIEDLYCVVARSVTTPLPSEQRIPLKDVLIGDRTIATVHRYGTDIDRDYRKIEEATHRPDETLSGVVV